MRIPTWIRQHLAALRALLVLTVITGVLYPLAVWAVAFLPGLHDKAEGSMITTDGGKVVGSELIGQLFTDKDGNPLKQYFQSRPSAAGTGYDPTSTGASNLGPESIQDTLPDPAMLAKGATPAAAGFKTSLLTAVCTNSATVGSLEGVDGSRPFCTAGVGAVLSVMGPRDSHGTVVHPTQVVSVNEECAADPGKPVTPFISTYLGITVTCAQFGGDYSAGQIVPIRGNAPSNPQLPADAVTASGSGLDPHISPAYADLQTARIAMARGVPVGQIAGAIEHNTSGRTLGFLGEPRVNVLALNIELDKKYPVQS